MTRELASFLTALIADYIDDRPYINEYMSEYECDRLEAMLVREDFSEIQKFIEHQLAWDKENEKEL